MTKKAGKRGIFRTRLDWLITESNDVPWWVDAVAQFVPPGWTVESTYVDLCGRLTAKLVKVGNTSEAAK
jgi:hypothetical protein